MRKEIRGIHVLLGASAIGKYSVEDLAEIAVRGGAAAIQLREKIMPMDEVLPIAKRIREICNDILFIVNDRADLALLSGADGVHLGQEDLPIVYAREILGEKSVIGISCGSVEEAIRAEKEGAAYIGFGHMYPTSSKIKITNPRTVEELALVCSNVPLPVIAIGGITPENSEPLLELPVGGLAILSAFSQAEDPEKVIATLTRRFTARQ
ncbi:MAG: thiamine phosphate synthase [Bacteroidota bacterium]|nr:thiamine phosphate synthase [Bacteroidota bacterium]